MKNQHTPGPWIAYNADGGRILKSWRVQGSDHLPICKMLNDGQSPEMELANANLISAATDLLSALKEAVEYLETFACHDEQGRAAIKSAIAAIAKAEGAK